MHIVAVQFNTGDVKLDGDSSGLLGIYLSGNWGTVSHVNFSKGTADVVCHQLGYSGALNFSVANGTLMYVPTLHACVRARANARPYII